MRNIQPAGFVELVSYFGKFRTLLGLDFLSFEDLEGAVGLREQRGGGGAHFLLRLCTKLLRPLYRSINSKKIPHHILVFMRSYRVVKWSEANFSVGRLRTEEKLELLLQLCWSQFDYNGRFRTSLMDYYGGGEGLREGGRIGTSPTSSTYHHFTDALNAFRIYREVDGGYELVAEDGAGLRSLVEELRGEEEQRQIVVEIVGGMVDQVVVSSTTTHPSTPSTPPDSPATFTLFIHEPPTRLLEAGNPRGRPKKEKMAAEFTVAAERPSRQSSRIANLRIKELEERRRAEEIELERLRGRRAAAATPPSSPEPRKRRKRGRPAKAPKNNKIIKWTPMDSSSERSSEEIEHEEAEEQQSAISSHEFSPESDLDGDASATPTLRRLKAKCSGCGAHVVADAVECAGCEGVFHPGCAGGEGEGWRCGECRGPHLLSSLHSILSHLPDPIPPTFYAAERELFLRDPAAPSQKTRVVSESSLSSESEAEISQLRQRRAKKMIDLAEYEKLMGEAVGDSPPDRNSKGGCRRKLNDLGGSEDDDDGDEDFEAPISPPSGSFLKETESDDVSLSEEEEEFVQERRRSGRKRRRCWRRRGSSSDSAPSLNRSRSSSSADSAPLHRTRGKIINFKCESEEEEATAHQREQRGRRRLLSSSSSSSSAHPSSPSDESDASDSPPPVLAPPNPPKTAKPIAAAKAVAPPPPVLAPPPPVLAPPPPLVKQPIVAPPPPPMLQPVVAPPPPHTTTVVQPMVAPAVAPPPTVAHPQIPAAVLAPPPLVTPPILHSVYRPYESTQTQEYYRPRPILHYDKYYDYYPVAPPPPIVEYGGSPPPPQAPATAKHAELNPGLVSYFSSQAMAEECE